MTETDGVPAPDVILTDAVLVDGSRVDVEVTDGLVSAVIDVGEPLPARTSAARRYDLSGRLLVPSFVEAHAHVDKALTADRVPNPSGDLMGAIDGWVAAAAAGEFSPEDTAARAQRALELLLVNGVTAVRTHVNVGGAEGASSVVAVRRAAEALAGLIDVEIVALTASPMSGADGAANRAALISALEAGADVVGGCPQLEPDPGGMIADVLGIAERAGVPVDLHIDETLDPGVLTLEMLARAVIDGGIGVPIAAGHCVSLGMLELAEQERVAALVARAGISVVTLPQTNLFLQGRELRRAVPRGLAAIASLCEAGVTVAAGADNVEDPFNIMGRSDPLETAALLVMAAHRTPAEALEMVAVAPRAMMATPAVAARVAVGQPADLVAIAAPSLRGAIATAPHDRMVFRSGVLVARSSEERHIVR